MSKSTAAPGVHPDSEKHADGFHPEYYDQVRPEVARLLPENYSKVLEIGCGKGLFRNNLTKENEYWGVEPVESQAKEAEKHLDKVLHGIYDDVADEIPDHEFDLVVCNDVIEHMVDHEKFFRDIKKKDEEGSVSCLLNPQHPSAGMSLSDSLEEGFSLSRIRDAGSHAPPFLYAEKPATDDS